MKMTTRTRSLGFVVVVGLFFFNVVLGDDQQATGAMPLKGVQSGIPKTILDLQPFRKEESLPVKSRTGTEGRATLVNLKPAINAWYLLKVVWKDGSPESVYHLENPNPGSTRLLLGGNGSAKLVIERAGVRNLCDVFETDDLKEAKSSQLIFHPLCQGLVYVRNPAVGRRSTLESATEYLRDRVWGGEKIIALGHVLLGSSQREAGKLADGPPATVAAKPGESPPGYPMPALTDSKVADRLLTSNNLGIPVTGGAERTGMLPGAWYAADGNPGIYVTILQPNLVDPTVLQSYKSIAPALDSIEAAALCYLIAFDLDRFDLAYALGTDHPRVEWSARVLEKMKNSNLPGPDGIADIRPLVATGLVSPADSRKTVAAFTSGFKRAHGAFRYGDLALQNYGSHYGFIENGVVLSSLNPGLATLLVLRGGSLQMKTWGEADNTLLPQIRYARQNGVALIEVDPTSKSPAPGRLVGQWGPGNWSGSAESRLRTMRAGVALQRRNGKRFLIYGVFSDATPSAMARVFQAYRCDYAMLLDMNALEHTYLATYRRSESRLIVSHLLKGMSVLDKTSSGELVPRFLGYPDNRDFFYITRRDVVESKP